MTVKALAERYGQWPAAVVAAVCHWKFFPQAYPAHDTEFFGNVVSLSGVAVGFLATGQALLCSLTDNFVVKTLRKLNRMEDMLRFFTSAILWCLFLAVFSLAGNWMDFKKNPSAFTLWLGIFAGASFASLRVLRLFAKVLHGSERT